MKKIISVVGARPNFMKIAPIHRAFLKYKEEINHLICHTGQHYDEKMSKIFFDDLELPKPDFYLGVQCITIRTTTERPITVELGTNQLVGDDYLKAEQVAKEVLNGKKKQGKIPEKWDGKTAERITEIILLKLL